MTGFYQLDLFAASLPRWLACTDHPADGITRLPAAEAIKRAHIAPNSRSLAWALTFDVDRPEAGAALAGCRFAATQLDCPKPGQRARTPRLCTAGPGVTLFALAWLPAAVHGPHPARHDARATGRPGLYALFDQDPRACTLAHHLGQAAALQPGRDAPSAPRESATSQKNQPPRSRRLRAECLAVRLSEGLGVPRTARIQPF